MISSARQVVSLLSLFGYAVTLVLLVAWPAIAARAAAPFSLGPGRHCRGCPPLPEQEPPGWLAALARVVLVLALAALGFASLLGCADRSP